MNLIFNKILDNHKRNLPFSAYRKPNSNIISGFFQKTDELFLSKNYSESGFVFAPFDDKSDAILIPKNQSEFLQSEELIEKDLPFKVDFLDDFSSKKSHIELTNKAIKWITEGELKKVVISRVEAMKFSNFDLIKIYKKLLLKYTNAFVYIWFHPKIGLWFGATPETLLSVKDGFFKTMSLAGTQVYQNTENVVWESKELEEQQLVTDFIENQLNPIVADLKVDNTETVKAGSLLHLRTKFSGRIKTQSSTLKLLIKALHPTPAVCGLPREESKEFILNNENYIRTFYTGFLGELNLEGKKTSLFVNLRCMEVESNLAKIYVGGGITKDSNPESEWKETVSKSRVMKTVL